MKKLGISSQQRIRSSLDFDAIYNYRQKVWSSSLLIFGMPNQKEVTRFGVSVSKRHGNAVVRARLKRLLREAFRQSQHQLPQGMDIILIPQKDAKATVDDFCTALIKLTKKLQRRFQKEKGQE